MRVFFILTILMAIALSMACSSTKKGSKSHGQEDQSCADLILLDASPDSLQNDPYQLDSIHISDGCLTADVTYGGGCGEVDFKLYYTNIVTRSLPPQTSLYLTLKDEDPCRSLVSRKILFDLKPLQKMAKAGGIVLLVGQKRILYTE
jgi:hypothetical protein